MDGNTALALLRIPPESVSSEEGGAEGAVQRALVEQLRAMFLDRAQATWSESGQPTAGTDQSDPSLEPAFSARSGPSLAVPGELGLFARGGCEPGTICALYPGVVYDATDLPMMHSHLLQGNGYVVCRRDGVLIDARQTPPSSTVYEMACARDRASKRETPASPLAANPWAVGHFANHPPEDREDNIALYPLDLSAAQVARIGARWIPNVNFRPPADADALVRTVALLALRPLADGEELLLDYQLSSEASRRPAWYRPVVRKAGAADGAR